MRVLGLDGGIASVGWALLDFPDDAGQLIAGKIVAAGAWMFDPPEDKGQTGVKLRSAERRQFRGQRRVISRRRKRMNDIRRLFKDRGLLASADRDSLKIPGLDPWNLRAAGLERVLTAGELAVALGHIARHRGFKSNARDAASNAPADDKKKMLKASTETREKLARYGSPARMLVEDASFADPRTGVRRFRNREGDYSRSLLRDDLAAEIRDIFRAQRRLQNAAASADLADLEEAFVGIAFFQRPLQDSAWLVGPCPFETSQQRASKRSPAFELFRYLSRLNTLKIIEGRDVRRLSVQELAKAAADFGATAKVSYSALRNKIGLAASARFEGVSAESEGKHDVVARSGEAAAGTKRLRELIAGHHGEMTWRALAERSAIIDRVAQIISFGSTSARIAKDLEQTDLDPAIRATLAAAAERGEFDIFTGAGHVSAKAARAIIPGLLQGLTYDKACAATGYDRTASRERHAFDVGTKGKEALRRILSEQRISREVVSSPTARKALIEMIKQVKAIIEEYGVPDRIHVELARDVGKSIEERDEISRGIEKRNKEKDKLRAEFADKIGRPPKDGKAGADELLRFELWKQQNGFCLYSEAYISPLQLVDGENSVQVDHILPWPRFGDDSFHNKTLCTVKSNQDKKGRTPFEWFRADRTDAEWEAFEARVKAIPYMKGMKRRNYLLRDDAEQESRFLNRNLNDTRWTCRLLAEALKQLWEPEKDKDGKERRRVFARPGALTDRLRRAWGLQWMKKDAAGKRIPDDRHHALDAIIVAATTESLLQQTTREVQENERKGLGYDLTKYIHQPWPGFREAALEATEAVFVARAERRRARGKAHDATIKQIREVDGGRIVFERKAVEKLTEKDLERIPTPEPYGRVADPKKLRDALVESLRCWIAVGKPKDNPPRSPKGDIIRKVRLQTNDKVAVEVNGGTVDRGDMARIDVFRKKKAKGARQYYLVPIYPHEIATSKHPPMRAVQGGGDEGKWPTIDSSFEFIWSIHQMSLLEITKPDGEVILSYFRGFDINTGALKVSDICDSTATRKGIGARTLLNFRKFAVDRFGRKFEIERETRTWRGKACT